MDARALTVMIVVGALVGALAGWIVPSVKWGFAGSVLVGLGGGVLGGWMLGAGGVRPKLGHPLADSAAVGGIAAVGVLVLARLLS